MKRWISVWICICMVLSLCTGISVTAATTASGSCGANLTWVLDSSGKLTISGAGAMQNWSSYSSVPWYQYQSSITSVEIKSGVTSIGNSAFYYCKNLTSVTIPNSVTSIGEEAFRQCKSLSSITIPNSVTSIGEDAFCHCDGLTSITIPSSVTVISGWAFSYCSGLTSITIPNSVTVIEESAFYYCDGLTSITIPSSVTSIGKEAFSLCKSLTNIAVAEGNAAYSSNGGVLYNKTQTEILCCPGGKTGDFVIPSSVTVIGDWAFLHCNLTSITIPNSVKSIGSKVFYSCYNLRNITIPNSVKSIGMDAFYSCISLTSTTIPNSVTNIGSGAFRQCSGLTSITIPNSVTNIGSGAFRECSGLTSITISESVTSIGMDAFSRCYSLKNIVVAEGNTVYNSYDGVLYNKIQTEIIYCPLGKTGDFVFPNSVTSIGEYAFREHTGLTSIIIPESVKNIGYSAFAYCRALKNVTIPESMTSIENYAFSGCSALTDVYYMGTQAQWDAMTIGSNNEALTNATLHCALASGTCGTTLTWKILHTGTLTISGTGAMKDYSGTSAAPWHAYVDNINTISLADGITSIGNYAFSDCKNVTEILLPSSVTDIGEYAFAGCTALIAVNIPSGVTAIEKYTFYHCAALSAPTLPDTVASIGEYAFFGCSSMTEMQLPASVKSMGAYAFSGCSQMESINIPSGVTVIEAYTFNGNKKLSEIQIPDTVTTIKEFAFSECSSIPSVVIPKSVTEIQRGAFSNCTSLTSVTIPDSVSTIGTSIFAYVSENVTIKCYLDTAAYQYATDNEISYELMSWGILEGITFTKTAIQGGAMITMRAPKGTIYYTTNGTEPTTSSTVYTAPIMAKKNMTIKAIAIANGWDNSAVAEFYTDIQKVATPYASAASGRVMSGTKIELYCETEGAEILYTTDGNIPTEADVYTGEIEITEDTTIYAVAVKDGMIDSGLATYQYELSNAEDTPLVTTLEATNITETSAKLSASVDDNNGVLRMVEFIYYEKNNSSVKYNVVADDSYNAVVTGLTPNTEYWYQARALNELGWTMGYIESFKTDAQGVIKPTSIEITPGYVAIKVGGKKTLLATVLPAVADNRDVYWSSEDPNVATVDKNGVVTAVGLGNTKIKATTVSNRLVAYCSIDVISSDVRGEFNFSEHNMITNSSHYDAYGFDHGVNAGGNALMASAYLARWDGAVLEENDAYPDGLANVKFKEADADYHVQNIIYLPYRKDNLDNDEIKNAIMKYGPVYTSFQVNWNQFDASRTNYYYPDNLKVTNGGHAIVIVGWDDNYSKMNFVTTPPGDGAFICKNSWGSESGDKGYFYISYYDKYIARANCNDYNAVFYDIEGNDNYNKIYQYDYLGPVAATNEFGTRSLYTANVFPEAGSALREKEQLKAVSFYNYAPGMSYEIYIVTNYQNSDSLKTIGSPVKSGVAEHAGYLTVKLDEVIDLAVGTRFAVVIKTTAKSGAATIFVELPAKLSNGTSHSSNAKANKDESYIGMDKKTWMDLTEFKPNANLCIKAFTETDDTAVMLQGIDNIGRAYTDDTVLSVAEWEEKGMMFNDHFTAYYKDSSVQLFETTELGLGMAPPSVLPDLETNNHYAEGTKLPARYDLRDEGCMTSVKHQLDIGSCWSFATYASLESSIKKASFSSASTSSDGLSQATGDAASVSLDTTGTILALGNKLQLKATVLPFDSKAELVWKCSNHSIVSVSSYGLVTALGVGQATVTVSTADGKISAACAITVTEPVSVDNITINNTESQLVAGSILLLDYSVYPENAGDKNIIWEVDDSSVASVNAYGLLTAKTGGTVTVTAYSSDRTVSDTYTIEIDDGYENNVTIIENNLGVYDTNMFGSLSANVTNKTSDAVDGCIAMVVYDSMGKIVKVILENQELAVGDNPVEFKNIYVSNLTDTNFKVRIFVWSSMQNLQPISIAKEDAVE